MPRVVPITRAKTWKGKPGEWDVHRGLESSDILLGI